MSITDKKLAKKILKKDKKAYIFGSFARFIYNKEGNYNDINIAVSDTEEIAHY